MSMILQQLSVSNLCSDWSRYGEPFDAHCCHVGTAMKHTVPDRVKSSFVIFDIRALWRLALSVRV